jgi:hypothetical protein
MPRSRSSLEESERSRGGPLLIRPDRWWVLVLGMVLTSCDLGPSDRDTEMYVRVPPEEAEKFTSTLASVLKNEGLSASLGRTTERFPRTNHVLHATSLNVRVWAQNAVLDPEESKACGYPAFSPVEQTQYVVSVQRRTPLSGGRARRIFDQVRATLAQRGYAIAPRQMPCQPLTKLPTS